MSKPIATALAVLALVLVSGCGGAVKAHTTPSAVSKEHAPKPKADPEQAPCPHGTVPEYNGGPPSCLVDVPAKTVTTRAATTPASPAPVEESAHHPVEAGVELEARKCREEGGEPYTTRGRDQNAGDPTEFVCGPAKHPGESRVEELKSDPECAAVGWITQEDGQREPECYTERELRSKE